MNGKEVTGRVPLKGVNESPVFKIPLERVIYWRDSQSTTTCWGQECWGHVAVKGDLGGRTLDAYEWLMGRGGMDFGGSALISPAWPEQRWHPGPAWRAGATPGRWCCRRRTGEGKCPPSRSQGSGWWRFLRRDRPELWPFPWRSACGSRSGGKKKIQGFFHFFYVYRNWQWHVIIFACFFLPWHSPLQECGWCWSGSRPWNWPCL